MPTNQENFTHFAGSLTSQSNYITLGVGYAITQAWRRLIRDPDDISLTGRIYEATIRKLAGSWQASWQDWADVELASAYMAGLRHTEAELQQLRAQNPGFDPGKPNNPLGNYNPFVSGSAALQPTPDFPDRIRSMFGRYPDHTTFYGMFRRAAYFRLEGTHLQIMRAGNDIWRRIATEAGQSMFREADEFTRRTLAQAMLDRFADSGLQAITYSNGRRVSLDAYAEMVGRTMSGRCAVQASLNRFAEYGYDLVQVTSHTIACPLCLPWENAILSQSGKAPGYPTLEAAIAAGLFHPNCAHDIIAVIPGLSPTQQLTRLDPAMQNLVDQHGYSEAQAIAYNAQQRQRYNERKIREWKRREVVALDDHKRAAAKTKVREWQAAQRAHLNKYQFLPRKYAREQIKRAH